jgi:hypothetical protein
VVRRRVWLLGGFAAAGVLLGLWATDAGAAPAALGTNPGAVRLSPASGPTSGKPAWSTSVGCPTGFQQSAVFSEVHADGTTFTTIAPVVDAGVSVSLSAPFSGSLEGTMARVQSVGGIPDGGTQELFVQCASGLGGTGSVKNEMSIYVTYSADGTTYTTSATQPSASATSGGSSAGSSGSAGSAGGTGAGSSSSDSSSSGGTGSGSASSDPASSASPAPSPSSLASDFPVTG